MSDEADADGIEPPPQLIVGLPKPERRVGKIIGDMSEAEARSLSASVSCGVYFGSRSADDEARRARLKYPKRERVRPPWPHERPARAAQERLDARVEVIVEVGEELAMVCPTGAHGVCLIMRSGCDCEG